MTIEKPGSRLRNGLINLGVSLASLVVFLLFCEFVLFRFVLPGSDVPRNDFVNEVVRYAPNQQGVWRIRDEVAAPFSINAQGWNSPLPDYPRERRPGVRRIAFVGDSFVEALQVPVGRSFAEVVQAGLAPSAPTETFRFALAGAPLSQYLHMVEREVLATKPDTIVVLLVHNDFDESFVYRPGRYTSSFLKLKIEDGKVTGEIPPQPWRPGAVEWLRQTATARYFLYRWQLRPQALVDAIFGPAHADDDRFAANIDVSSVLSHEAEIRVATDYVFKRLAERAQSIGARLLIAMDGDRRAIYAERSDSRALTLNRIAAEAAQRAGIGFLDLHPVFAADWAKNHRRFDFDADSHWNEAGHAVAGAAVLEVLKAQ
ncbi:GDSL-type esterase/lipase family protein [Bosea sp. BK604]|uniref:GDSL-type esterase/lipase family protein n=1 Tax=Bosea sp. BK604 TaxID=2512180 RepID=UPI00104D3A76|nr:GDSL-type esterase/lipase family protein [Bosea sp. BK604]TCR66490.1 GDSL-like lipase/acylhydrolase family protein [Bosea sp. BK604]